MAGGRVARYCREARGRCSDGWGRRREPRGYPAWQTFAKGGEEDLKARRIRSRHDQIDTSPILRRDSAVQIDVFANELGEATSGLMPIGAQHGRGRLMRP